MDLQFELKPPSKPKFQPTLEQQAILDAFHNTDKSIMVFANAGCTKTTMLELLANSTTQRGLALAFNVKIKQELEQRFPPTFDIKTLNGLGHSAWTEATGRHSKVNGQKLGKLVSEICKKNNFVASSDDWDAIRRLTTAAMLAGVVPAKFHHYTGLRPDTEDTWNELSSVTLWEIKDRIINLARQVLELNVLMAFQGEISFDDQVYCSALLGGRFTRYNLVAVDEAQDLNKLNHIQLSKVLTPSGRLIVVGDPRQSCYSFRGADSESMENIKALRSKWLELPLNVTFRCPQKVVQLCALYAPGYTAAPSAPPGEIIDLGGTPWSWSTIKDISQDQIAVLCRNNAPLLKLAFKFLRVGVPVMMLGRDIGKNLTALSKKIIPSNDTPIADCLALIDNWRTSESTLATANRKTHLLESIEDRAGCLEAVATGVGVKNARDLRDKLASLFARTSGKVILSSGHQAKGLEWHTVVILDQWRIPSKYAKSDSEMTQEWNLLHVMRSRTKHTLVTANLEDFVI